MSKLSRARQIGFALLPVMLLLVSASAFTMNVNASTDENALRTTLQNTYLQIIAAEQRGANVSLAVTKLNTALQLIDKASNESVLGRNELLTNAESTIKEVNSSIPSLIANGESTIFWSRVVLVSSVALLGITLILVYVYVPKLVWWLWLKMKRDWRISAK